MMDEKKRRNWGFAGSAIIHILIFLIVSFTGLFQFSHAQENIVEVTFFGGGGGGGSDDAGVIEEAEPEATAAEETSDNDAIFEANKEEKPAVVKKQQVKPVVKSSGKGKGTGQGSGTGSGIGPGSGSGSGGGHGSGHGTGTGSGTGPGSGVTSSPAVPPRIIKSYQPPYPSAERNAGVEGTVSIRFLIGTDGSVEDVTVTSSSGNANLDNVAVAACRKWRFTAAKNSSGLPVRCYASIPIIFKIGN
jgi:protein TonB